MKERKLNYREALGRRLGNLKTGLILDAGTGAGTMTKTLVNGLNLCVVSIDVNKRVFLYAFEKIDGNRAFLLACDFAHLPFKENTFYGIVCDLVISTSREWKPLSVYAEFRRVLKTGSSLFVTDYYPEKSPRTKEAFLAAETSRLYRLVSRAKGVKVQKNVPPESSVKQLRKAGFATVRKEKIEANEAQEWKKRVLEEYFGNMRKMISSLKNSRLKKRFTRRVRQLKIEIEGPGGIRWGWGANYLIEATR